MCALKAFPVPRLAVSFAFFLNGFGLGSWTPQVPVVGARLGFDPAAYGLMILVFGLGALAAMPVLAAFMARFGSRSPILASTLILALSFPLVSYLEVPALALFFLFLYGAGEGGMDAAMNANAVALERRLARPIVSSCHGFWSLGAMTGAGLGGVAIAGLGPLAHGCLVGLVMALALPILHRGLLDEKPVAAAQDERGSLTADVAGKSKKPVLLAVAIGFMVLAGFVQEGIVIDWSAVYLTSVLGVATAGSGLGLAVFSFAMALMRFAGDGIRARLGAVRTLRASLGFAIAGSLTLSLAGSLPVALLGFLILGIGLANVVPIGFLAAGNLRGLRHGTGITIATGIGYAGGLVAPAAIGALAAAYSFSSVFAGLAFLAAGLVLAAPLVRGADR